LEALLLKKAVFEGLVFDEFGNPVESGRIGNEPCYIVDDAGFRRHISAEDVDRQVWAYFQTQIEGHEDLLSEKAAEMLGQVDIFTMAAIQNQLKDMNTHYEKLAELGIPEDTRMYLGMMGFRIIISIHGEVLEIIQPGIIDDSGDD
jgi:hypothetical protein